MTKDQAAKVHLTRAHVRGLYKEMLRIRRFEEKCAELYTQEKIRGFLHLYIGEEAIAVGVMQALQPADAVVATYREHGHALARGIDMSRTMAEMYGKQDGCSRGHGGSMHIFDAGLALADKMLGRSQVTACFFGEGAVAEGEFHESMNLAALWQLPVLFVCENNLYAMGTALAISESETDIHRKAESYRMPSTIVDGMDIVATENAARRAVEAIRQGGGPAFLECRTYRFRAHSMFDAQLYRAKAEVEAWKEKCPIEHLRKWALDAGSLHAEDVDSVEAEVASELAAAIAFADSSPWESVARLLDDVHTPRQQP
jgi:pyruvate dehydrogenase E1 component alpha subunit